jgi:RHS repeat-associated protein
MNRKTALATATFIGLLALTSPVGAETYNFSMVYADYFTFALGVNNSGQVTGYYTDKTGNAHGFVEHGGIFTTTDYPSASDTFVVGINDSGQVTGFYTDTAGKTHGFIESGGIFTTIDYPSASGTCAEGINNSSQVTGYYTDDKGKAHGFIESGGIFTTIDIPSAAATEAFGINNSGQVVGYYTDKTGKTHGFVKTGNHFSTLDYASAADVFASGINDSGQVTGYYTDKTGNAHGFVEHGGIFTTLDYPSAVGTSASGISNSGQVTGYYTDSSGYPCGFLASPTIDPGVFSGTSNPAISIPNHSCGSIGVNPGLWAGDVNCFNGNLSEFEKDLSIPGRIRPLVLTRTYNALDAANGVSGMFGPGWTSSYGKSLTINSDESVVVHQETGATVTFTRSASGYTAPPYVTASLVKNRDNTYTFTLKNQLSDIFDANGRLIAQMDRNSMNKLETTLSYDDNGNLAGVTDAGGRTLYFTVSGGVVSSVSDPDGRTVSYSYDPITGDLLQVTDAGGGVTSYTYDSNHLLTSVTDPLGGQVSNQYDSSTRVVSRTNQLGKVTAYTYTSGAGTNTTMVTDPKGDVLERIYSNYVMTSQTVGYGTSQAATWTYAYDSGFNRVRDTDANGNIWKSAYDLKGNQVKNSDPLRDTVTIVYNHRNDPVAITDANGIATTYTYDSYGNLTSISRPLKGTAHVARTTYVYETKYPGVLTEIIGPTGARTIYTYGYAVTVRDPDGGKTTLSYDDLSQLISIVSPLGNMPGADPTAFTTAYTYDNFGDLISITDPLGNTVTWTYDAKRELVGFTDQDNRTTQYGYDASGRLATITRNDGTTLLSAYDDAGNLSSQTDALGHTTLFAYDELNRLTGVTDPLNRTTSYAYDPEGNYIAKTDPDGQTTSLAYDAANRLTGISYSDKQTPPVIYTYDAVGRRTAMSDGSGPSTYRYDSLGHMIWSKNGAGQTVSHQYDLHGLTIATTYPNNRSVSRKYDAAGRLVSVKDWLGNTTTFQWNADGYLDQATYPNGWICQHQHDNADRVTGISYTLSRVADLTFSYTRTNAGLLTSESINSGAQIEYTYDLLGRLTGVSGQSDYVYDDADRITAMPLNGSMDDFTYDAADQLATMTTSGTGVSSTFDYDHSGNRTGLPPPSFSYTFDLANRMTGYGTAASYAYDGDGLRTSKTVGGQTEQYTWDRRAPLPEILAATGDSYIYSYGTIPLEQVSAEGSVFFYHTDQLGSIRMLTDSGGTIKASYSFDAYGNTVSGGAQASPFGYAGAFTDAESGFLYMRARYYDPATAQFISADPLTGMTRQPYAYCEDSPLNRVDPTGLYSGTPERSEPDGRNSSNTFEGRMAAMGVTTGGNGVLPGKPDAEDGAVMDRHLGWRGSASSGTGQMAGPFFSAVRSAFVPAAPAAPVPLFRPEGR